MKWLSFFLILGCAQVTSLNLKKHQFGILPTKIIWFQVAGLDEEQLALLRFQQNSERKTSFEENICIGKTWNYNLYDIRVPAEVTFLAQITGKKNIKNTCEDTKHRPIWSYLSGNGYQTGILEVGGDSKQTLLALNNCTEDKSPYLDNTYIWIRREPIKNASTFHYVEDVPLKVNEPFYDKSCSGQSCFSNIVDDFKSVYTRFKKSSQKHLFIIRDFSYLKALEKGDFKVAKKILSDIEMAYSEALALAEDSNDYLILLTTGDSRYVEMPEKGKEWYEFEKKGVGVNVRSKKLTNLVLASGARAENFCGIYNDSRIFERILSGPKQQGLELKIINPFK